LPPDRAKELFGDVLHDLAVPSMWTMDSRWEGATKATRTRRSTTRASGRSPRRCRSC
jgi:hypothetical protein